MSTIPGSVFVAPGSCHSSIRKYHQIQKRQQSQEIDINAIPSTESQSKVMSTASPVGSPSASPAEPLSPLNKIRSYFRQFSNPGATGIQEFNVPNIQSDVKSTSMKEALGGFNNNFLPQGIGAADQVSDSPLNSPRSDAEN